MTVEAVVWIAFAVVGISGLNFLLKTHRLYTYLMDAHYERWKHITTVPGMGPGMSNPLRGVDYLFGDQDEDDPQVARLRLAVKKSLFIIAGALVAAVIAVVGAVLIAMVLEASK